MKAEETMNYCYKTYKISTSTLLILASGSHSLPITCFYYSETSRQDSIDSRDVSNQVCTSSKSGDVSDESRGGIVDKVCVDLRMSMSRDRLPHQPRSPNLDNGIAIDVSNIVDLEQAGQIRAWSFEGGLIRSGV